MGVDDSSIERVAGSPRCLEDLPRELLQLILEHGYSDENFGWPNTQGGAEIQVFNRDQRPRRKLFCQAMASVSKNWIDLIQNTPSCWYILVLYPGIRLPFKYDVSLDIAQCQNNLRRSPECDIVVRFGQKCWSVYPQEPQYFPLESRVIPANWEEVDGLQHRLLIHAIACLRPYAYRIIDLDILAWGCRSMGAILHLMRSFGPMPRLRRFVGSDNSSEWYSQREDLATGTISTPLLDTLGLPLHTDTVNVRDISFMTTLQSYTTSYLGTASKLPGRLTSLEVVIWNQQIMDSLRWDVMESILIHCPELRDLDLKFLRVSNTSWKSALATRKQKELISFRHLRRCTLTTLCDISLAMLSRIRADALEYIWLGQPYAPGANEREQLDPPEYRSISFPNLRSVCLYGFSLESASPLWYMHTPTLRSIEYNDGEQSSSNFSSSRVPFPADRPQLGVSPISSERLDISADFDELPLIPLVELLAQHDLSKLEHLSLSVFPDPNRDPESVLHHNQDTLNHLCPAFCQDAAKSVRMGHRLAAPRLRMVSLNSFHCMRVIEAVLTCLDELDSCTMLSFEKFELGIMQAIDPEIQVAWNKRRLNIESLTVDLSNLIHGPPDPAIDLSTIHPLTAFSNLRLLMLHMRCRYDRCRYRTTSNVISNFKALGNLRPLAELAHLGYLAIEVSYAHNPYYVIGVQYKELHHNMRNIVAGATSAIRSVQHARKDLNVSSISEIYVIFAGVPAHLTGGVDICRIPLRIR
jgi:hypothetical protein